MTEREALKKIEEDFEGAKEYWGEHFDKWVFAHNAMNGLPPHVQKTILDFEKANPKIYAAYTEDQYYHDPAVILIKDSKVKLLPVLAILNSKLATYFHFNSSPKATKGDFPKILVKDIKDFPLPDIDDDAKKKTF